MGVAIEVKFFTHTASRSVRIRVAKFMLQTVLAATESIDVKLAQLAQLGAAWGAFHSGCGSGIRGLHESQRRFGRVVPTLAVFIDGFVGFDMPHVPAP